MKEDKFLNHKYYLLHLINIHEYTISLANSADRNFIPYASRNAYLPLLITSFLESRIKQILHGSIGKIGYITWHYLSS